MLVCSLPTATLPTWGCSCWLLLIAILLLGVHVCVPLLFDKPPDDDAFTSLPLHNSLLEACSLFATAVILLCEESKLQLLCKTSSVSDSCKSDCSSTRIFPFTLGCCSALALSPVQRAGRNHLPPLFLLTTCLLDTNITRAQQVLTISPLITFSFSQICDFVSFRCLHSSDIKAALFGFSPHPQFS